MNKEKLNFAVENAVSKYNCLLVDLLIRGTDTNRILEIYVDNDEGVSTKMCADISRELGDVIENENIISSRYRLDISSPGVDRPLKFLPQFKKHINRKLSVELNEHEEKFEGVLLEVVDETLVFKVKNEEKVINFNKIKTAMVLISF
ncbi:MAG: hypothetical protein JEY94_08935 [Melioribacteraceae bacterium]|nr:hypothetical protein [Melioribacteraceae bacterium]